jgi:hypothetical protein
MLRQKKSETRSFGCVFAQTTWGNRTTFSACQAGMINNLNDGMSWRKVGPRPEAKQGGGGNGSQATLTLGSLCGKVAGTVSHGDRPGQEGVAETWVSAEMGASETLGSDQGRDLFPPRKASRKFGGEHRLNVRKTVAPPSKIKSNQSTFDVLVSHEIGLTHRSQFLTPPLITS